MSMGTPNENTVAEKKLVSNSLIEKHLVSIFQYNYSRFDSKLTSRFPSTDHLINIQYGEPVEQI